MNSGLARPDCATTEVVQDGVACDGRPDPDVAALGVEEFTVQNYCHINRAFTTLPAAEGVYADRRFPPGFMSEHHSEPINPYFDWRAAALAADGRLQSFDSQAGRLDCSSVAEDLHSLAGPVRIDQVRDGDAATVGEDFDR